MQATLNRVPYAGGGTPFEEAVRYEFNRTQLGLDGFTSDDATIEYRPTGSDTYKTVDLSTEETAFVIEGSIDSIRVSSLSAGDYTITALQWTE